MKRSILMLSLFAMSVGFTSCQKCYECTDCPLGINSDACMNDFDSKEDYDAALANLRASGCDCVEKAN